MFSIAGFWLLRPLSPAITLPCLRRYLTPFTSDMMSTGTAHAPIIRSGVVSVTDAAQPVIHPASDRSREYSAHGRLSRVLALTLIGFGTLNMSVGRRSSD